MADEVRLIDKDKLIKKIKAEIDAWAKSRMCMTADELLETIEEFEEEAEPDNGWISVKDRLPPYGERVLVVNETYEAERGYTKYNCGITIRDPHLDFTFWGHKVTHWQPLPKPPKGE